MGKLIKIKERYPALIEAKMLHIEGIYADQIHKQLQSVNAKIRQYILDQVQILKSRKQDIKDLVKNKFIFQSSILLNAAFLGVSLQKARFQEENVISNIPIGLVNPSDELFAGFLQTRALQLNDVLETTTEDAINGFITDGINQGKSYTEIAQNLQGDDMFGFNAARSELIAKTESNYILNESTRRYNRALGIDYQKIILGPNPCPICQDAAQEQYTIEEEDILPIHPRCYCTWEAVIPDNWAIDDNSDE